MGTEIKKAICMWCHSHCKVDVHVKDGKLEKVVGVTDDPRSSGIQRVVNACARPRAATEYFYHPDRLKYPLKRTGGRGEGQWEQIPWEQALDEVAEKLATLRNQYGAETLACSSGTYRTHDEYRSRFLNLFGTPNNIGQGHICYGPGITGVALLGWWNDFGGIGSNTKCSIIWGSNPKEAYRNVWLATQDHLKRKGKLIVIDPRRTDDAKKADIWLQLRPGTDAALALGMINVIIREEIYDRNFVEKWCYGFDKLRERAEEYPLSRVEDITWVPSDKIKDAAMLYATTRPAHIFHSMGIEQLPNSVEAYQARTILTMITGNLDIKGGEELRGGHPQVVTEYETKLNHKITPEQKKKQIGVDSFRLQAFPGFELIMEKYAKSKFGKGHVAFAHAPSVYRAMITGKPYPVMALISAASNPLVTQANSKLVYQAIKNLDLYVVVDLWRTPSAELADYVFPAACWLERPVFHTWSDTFGFVDCGEQAMPARVEGEYDRRPDYAFWSGLGNRLGQERNWPWKTLEEAFDDRLKPMGVTFKELCEKGGYTSWPKEEKNTKRSALAPPPARRNSIPRFSSNSAMNPCRSFTNPLKAPIAAPTSAGNIP